MLRRGEEKKWSERMGEREGAGRREGETVLATMEVGDYEGQ